MAFVVILILLNTNYWFFSEKKINFLIHSSRVLLSIDHKIYDLCAFISFHPNSFRYLFKYLWFERRFFFFCLFTFYYKTIKKISWKKIKKMNFFLCGNETTFTHFLWVLLYECLNKLLFLGWCSFNSFFLPLSSPLEEREITINKKKMFSIFFYGRAYNEGLFNNFMSFRNLFLISVCWSQERKNFFLTLSQKNLNLFRQKNYFFFF